MHFTNEPKRIYYIFAILLSIVLGLASRNINTLPHFIVNHAGDILWALMVYFLLRFIFVHKSQHTALFLSFVFCFSIELSQLYQEAWLNKIRGTLIGSLILGKGFVFIDLVRYTIGIIVAFVLDKWIFLQRKRKTTFR